MATRAGQKLSGHLVSIRKDLTQGIEEKFRAGGDYGTVLSSMFVNMDETAVFFESKPKSTVHRRGDKTVSVRCSGSNSKRATVCVSVASDGTKLPLFIIFKGQPNGRIEKKLLETLPENMYGSCHSKGWMDEHSLKIWTDCIWKPCVSGYGNSVLLSDDFSRHKQTSFLDYLKSLETDVELIPGGYTCVLQPCDVRVMRSLKVGIQKKYMDLASMVYSNLESHQRLPFPDRKDVSSWTSNSFEAISSGYIRATFDHIGFTEIGQSPPATPYPVTPFPVFEESDDSSMAGRDVVEIDEA